MPFLPIRADLAPKRNQARQKMATLPETRFKELATELFVEIEKRAPQVLDSRVRILFNMKGQASPQPNDEEKQARSRPARGERSNGDRRREDPGADRGISRDRMASNSAGSAGSGPASEGSGRRRQETSQDQYHSSRKAAVRDKSNDPLNRFPSPSLRSDDNSGAARNGDPSEEISKIRSDYEFKLAMLEKQLKSKNDNGMAQMEAQLSKLEQLNLGLHNDFDSLQADYEKQSQVSNDSDCRIYKQWNPRQIKPRMSIIKFFATLIYYKMILSASRRFG